MAAPLQRFEALDTRQFTVTYSTQPSTPYLAIYAGNSNTLVSCQTAAASSDYAFYAYVTFPNTPLYYSYVWVASYTSGPVRTPTAGEGVFKVVRTVAPSSVA